MAVLPTGLRSARATNLARSWIVSEPLWGLFSLDKVESPGLLVVIKPLLVNVNGVEHGVERVTEGVAVLSRVIGYEGKHALDATELVDLCQHLLNRCCPCRYEWLIGRRWMTPMDTSMLSAAARIVDRWVADTF